MRDDAVDTRTGHKHCSTHTADQASSLCTLGYANSKAGAKMPINYCYWGVTKNLQAIALFKPAPDTVTFGHLLSEVSFHNLCRWKHLPFNSHCLTITEWKGAKIMHNWTEFELSCTQGWRQWLSNVEWPCFLQGHKQEKQPQAGIVRKSTREVDKAAECITATTTCSNKYILFLCRTKLVWEDLKALLKCLMMHSSWWETGFIVIYQQKQRPRWQGALLQAQQDIAGV